MQYVDGKLSMKAVFGCSSLQQQDLYLREVSKNRTLAQCVSSKLDLEFDTLQPTCGHLQAQAGLAVATVDWLSNDTVRDLCCLHT